MEISAGKSGYFICCKTYEQLIDLTMTKWRYWTIPQFTQFLMLPESSSQIMIRLLFFLTTIFFLINILSSYYHAAMLNTIDKTPSRSECNEAIRGD